MKIIRKSFPGFIAKATEDNPSPKKMGHRWNVCLASVTRHLERPKLLERTFKKR